MEPAGSMPHSQGLSNYSFSEPNQPNSPHWYLSLQGPFYIYYIYIYLFIYLFSTRPFGKVAYWTRKLRFDSWLCREIFLDIWITDRHIRPESLPVFQCPFMNVISCFAPCSAQVGEDPSVASCMWSVASFPTTGHSLISFRAVEIKSKEKNTNKCICFGNT